MESIFEESNYYQYLKYNYFTQPTFDTVLNEIDRHVILQFLKTPIWIISQQLFQKPN